VTAFEARVSPKRVLVQLAASLMFIAMGALMVFGAGVPAGWLVMAGFAIWFLVVLPRLFQTGLDLRVDAEGIWSRRWPDRTIRWCAIRQLRVLDVENTRSIWIYLVDPVAMPSGKLSAVRRAAGGGDLAINLNGTDRDFDDLLAAVRHFAPPALSV
jgi:hypothetical protein